MKDKANITAPTRRLAKKRVQCSTEAFCFVSSSVLAEGLRFQMLINANPETVSQYL